MDKPRTPMSELHRLHDGELDATETARVEAGLGDEDRERVRAIADVGAAVRNTVAAQSQGVDLWAGIEKRLQLREANKVVPLASRRRGGLTYVRYGLPALAAAAAAVVLWLNVGSGPQSNACDVEMLDIAGASATVLKVPDVRGQGSTTVIWTTEE